MADESEQKTLPASEKKLRDARVKRGQVAHSKDFVTGVSLAATLALLFFAWPNIRDHILQLLDAIASYSIEPFAQSAPRAVGLALDVLLTTGLTVGAVVVLSVIAAGLAATAGPVFSFDLVTPKMERINPVDGAKRIFSLRNLVEFAKGLAKLIVLFAAFWFAISGRLQSLFQTPDCGSGCIAPVTLQTLKPLAAAAAIAFIAIGLVDMLVQRRLFLRDMRMTRTEYKREQKDLEGDPLIRSERRRIHRRLAASQTRTGLRHAVVAIAHGDQIVGLRYQAGDTPIPVVVSKGRGELGQRMRAEARERGITIVEDPELAPGLMEAHAVGDTIKREFFGPIAQILFKMSSA
ncbi:MAG: EscU/YscU/HrcU family type III secretion system export apparatus switch protein [Bradyrhizobium sp.]|uniref:EscU/YscU/HrcU family type III secretion system export apparatus switch protein n=1 Tax=Bradyrhizobium sp. TaxID=376 RepID=UPI001DF78A55|nr:EscU/YscU/HrcU family type III secretion system export apparatus switch protein [Bradyrhizobium sp.]MBV9564308.1 EscU/YscU/HrcU family type III secretion system export apparatus switch protein [Bradyrhizobium sp.]